MKCVHCGYSPFDGYKGDFYTIMSAHDIGESYTNLPIKTKAVRLDSFGRSIECVYACPSCGKLFIEV